MDHFELVAPYEPTGDQPEAIRKLVEGFKMGLKEQTLLGVTGSGKTFTMANIIAQVNKPTLILAHNKTLAAQLCSEMREYFPHNAVEYFVSDNGYYKPGFEIFPVKEGYVLLMESSHSLGWRHGHAGLTVDNGYVLEAPIIGQPSMEYPIGMWEFYSSFIMLRLKETSDTELKAVADNAQKYLNGIMYNPLAGVFKKSQGKKPKTVQCAYLVWYAFHSMGIDIDSTGGNIVTVNDIKNSDKFEIVQIYGYDPDDFM